MNGKGRGHIRSFSELPNVRIAALCDVDSAVMDREVEKLKQEGETVKKYTDNRKLLDNKHIYAVRSRKAAVWPLLEIDTQNERFRDGTGEYNMQRWANDMLKDQYRDPFVVPEKV